MSENQKIQITSYILAALGLFAVLQLELLSALLAGLLIFQLVELGASALTKFGVTPKIGKVALLVLVAIIVVGGISAAVFALTTQVGDGKDGVVVLLQKMADAVDSAKSHMPVSVQEYLPTTLADWQTAAANWLRENASHLGTIGRTFSLFFVHMIVGMVVGGMVALGRRTRAASKGPLSKALGERVDSLSGSFRRIVFSQIRISGLNTILTAIYLTIILPLLGHSLPLTKTMILVTFVVGLLPIVGNLISNTVIVLVSLGVSLGAAVDSLVFLVVIHKLEYFVNARIIGSQIRSRAWELLIAMLTMEAAFGMPGLIAAPIYYAYLKDELSQKDLV